MFLGLICAEILKGSLTLALQMYKTQTVFILKLKQVNVVHVCCLLLLMCRIVYLYDFKVVHLIKSFTPLLQHEAKSQVTYICKSASGSSRTAAK